MSERPTPETDSQPLYDETEGGIRESINGQYVDADFARNLERQRDALLEALEKQACATAYYNGHSNGYKPHANGGLFWENYLCKEAVAAIAEAKGPKP